MERQRAAEAAALGRAGQEAQKLVEQRWKREAETHQAEAPGERNWSKSGEMWKVFFEMESCYIHIYHICHILCHI